ncbi:hypothetical protein [Agarivorans sp.]|uniref:hypothetical protein n=1 Tax=Agarivorans sp. TaxID=1872412 RepID=UPI003D045D6C
MKKWLALTALLGLHLSSFTAMATPISVDLSSWSSEGQGNWQVQTGNDAVRQSVNGAPTVFFDSSLSALDAAMSGSISVRTSSDDDFIGFVLGYQSGELNSASADFWLVDWKQGTQSEAARGLALSHVTGTQDYWRHTGSVNEIARGATLGSTGWADFASYDFDLVYTSSLLQVLVNGNLELSVSAAQAGVAEFADGAFGFYNYSQSDVLYSGLIEQAAEDVAVSVSETTSIPLFALALAGLFGFRRKAK